MSFLSRNSLKTLLVAVFLETILLTSGQTLTLEILERLDSKIADVSSEMGMVKETLRSMEQDINAVRNLGNTVNGLEKSVDRAFFEIQIQDETIRDVKSRNITKLERENLLWKTNFRTINATLSKLKRRLGIV